MKIAYVTAGAAGMYCGSCMHDNTLAAALQELGHECLLIPTYTPIRTDERDVSIDRVFFGGINVYLEQQSAVFRRMPAWLGRLLSLPRLLRWVSRFAVNTQPQDLGPMTVSMLQGVAGRQEREVRLLVDFLAADFQPQVVCLTNALLSGIIPELKRRLHVPIVVTLQGDDIFLDFLPEPYRRQAIELIRSNCASADRYIATSGYYADFMSAYLGLPRERMRVVYPGLNLAGFAQPEGDVPGPSPPLPNYRRHPAPRDAWEAHTRSVSTTMPAPGAEEALTVGYLARICPEKGLHLLVEAVALVKRMASAPPVRLRVAGYLPDNQRRYLAGLRRQAQRQGWGSDFEVVGEVDHVGKVRFLHSLDLFSVPAVYREPKGLYVLEAWASGVPVVLPAHGAFPELVAATGGGLTVEPGSAAALAEGLRQLLNDPQRRRSLADAGRRKTRELFHAGRMAADTLLVFQETLG